MMLTKLLGVVHPHRESPPLCVRRRNVVRHARIEEHGLIAARRQRHLAVGGPQPQLAAGVRRVAAQVQDGGQHAAVVDALAAVAVRVVDVGT